MRASLFITDYSSLFFDFAFLKKPIIYAQFDIEEYRKYIPKDYFEYKRDGFGPLCNKIDCVIDEIIKELNNNCRLQNNYLKRINKYFYFFDKNNNERIYNAIISNSEKKREKSVEIIIAFVLTIIFLISFIIKKSFFNKIKLFINYL